MESKYKEIILVPTDFSDVCHNAILNGAEIARHLKFELAIMHVIDKETKSQLKKENKDEATIDVRLKTIAEEVTKQFGIKVTTIARTGSIFSTIGEVAAEIRAGLLVLGTHGKVGLQQHLTGSFALKVVTTSPVPVIVVQKGSLPNRTYKDIVFPVSTTAEVRQKVQWVVGIAKVFRSKIHLVQLFEPLEETQKKMRVIVAQIMKKFEESNIEYVHFITKKGVNFGKQVLSYAQEHQADLITIMTTPDSLNFILGPYDEQMIFNAHKIPVMCVNPVSTTTSHWFGGA